MYLQYNLLEDLLKIDASVYMIHGEKDVLVPVKSAGLVYKAFIQNKKFNLYYARYNNLGHSMSGREDVYKPLRDLNFYTGR